MDRVGSDKDINPMRRSSRERTIYILSILFAAIPLAFALVRAFRTGNDLRYLAIALASWVAVALVMMIGKARQRAPKSVVAIAAVAFVVATLLTGWIAILRGTKAGFGVWAVAAFFSFCWATSAALNTFSRPERHGKRDGDSTSVRV